MEELRSLITSHLFETAVVILHSGFAWHMIARVRAQGNEIRALQAAEVARDARAQRHAKDAVGADAARVKRALDRLDEVEERLSEIGDLTERLTLLPKR